MREWYDHRHLANKMRARGLITLVVLLVSLPAGAQPARTPWRATVVSPRLSFPTVTIDLGYPGPYVPWTSAPITLRASAGDYPFDGYIGFQFRVNDHLTYDTPVIARAVLRPHEQWTFTTFARLKRGSSATPREIRVEWRDRNRRIAAVGSGGVPPWTLWGEPLRSLLIVGAEENVAEKTALGRAAQVQQANALSDRAQWYAGFSDVVVPLAIWLELPRRVREAIFGSAIHVVFFGFARPNQHLENIDQALLPVTFTPGAASYEAPWPYRQSGTAPASWAPKNGARFVGRPRLPYIVESPAATWSADEIGVSQPIPAMTTTPIRLRIAEQRSSVYDPNFHLRAAWPRPAQLLRMFPAATLGIAALIVSLSAWLAMRKRARAAGMIALLLSAVFILAARNRIRPPAGVYDMDIRTPVSPGIIRSIHARRVYGPTPMPEETADAELLRTSITDADDWSRESELRTPNTAVKMGLMTNHQPWDALTRWTRRNELGEPPQIRIISRDAGKIVLEFDSPVPVGYIRVAWVDGDRPFYGGKAFSERKSGRVTITHRSDVMEESEPSMWNVSDPGVGWSGAVVTLRQKNRAGTRWLLWSEPVDNEESFMVPSGRRQSPQAASWTFALPLESTSADATALVSLFNESKQVSISWANGTAALQTTGRKGLMSAPTFAIPPAVFREILAAGGIVKVTVAVEASADPRAWIEVWEKKS